MVMTGLRTTSVSNSERIPTNLRVLLVIEVLAEAGVPMTPTEINNKLGLPKPTIHRLCQTMESEGLIIRDIEGKRYRPARRLRRLATSILSSNHVHIARHAVLTSLSEEIAETCNIAIPDEDGMIYLDRAETHWPLRIQFPAGTKVPFHCTSAGKMFLSCMRQNQLNGLLRALQLFAHTPHTITDVSLLQREIATIREQGYSTDNEEFVNGMIAVAVPIKDSQGRLYATLSFHAPTQRMPIEYAIEHVPVLKNAAEKLAGLMSDQAGEIRAVS